MVDGMIDIIKIALLVLLLIMFGEGTALSGDDHDRAKQLMDAGDILPLEEIIEKAGREYPGRILETELEEKGDQMIYELEILDENGIVWELRFDARTGKLLKRKEDKPH